jgi:hypothetical protein
MWYLLAWVCTSLDHTPIGLVRGVLHQRFRLRPRGHHRHADDLLDPPLGQTLFYAGTGLGMWIRLKAINSAK